MNALFNEIEPYAAAWLGNLIAAGHIAEGEVDARSVVDVRPMDLAGRTQVHLFAGIGVWSHALRLAGWPDSRPVWTASFPCQPFSSAGKRRGKDDERHLWPVGFDLIRECRPPVILGEQVASPDGLGWWDAVQADLEGEGYACAAFDLCAPGVGAPHIRQRLYWMAYACGAGLEGQDARALGDERPTAQRGRRLGGLAHTDGSGLGVVAEPHGEPLARREACEPRLDDARRGDAGGLGHSRLDRDRQHPRELPCHEGGHEVGAALGDHASVAAGATGGLADADGGDPGAEGLQRGGQHRLGPQDGVPSGGGDRRLGGDPRPGLDRPGPTNGLWRDADWLLCRDGRWRPVEPGTFPLAHGTPARVGRLRAYGNAIVAPLAAGFVRAVMDTLDHRNAA